MSLADRLQASRAEQPVARATPTPPPSTPSASSPPSTSSTPAPVPTAAPRRAAAPKSEALTRLKDDTMETLYAQLGGKLNDPSLTETQLQTMVRDELRSVIAAAESALSGEERRRLVEEVMADVLGLGPIQELLADDTITEVMVNGPNRIYVEQSGKITATDVTFRDEAHLRSIIDRIVGRIGRRIDESSPLVDARLEDGSRVNAIIPPLAVSGSTLTIRKFSTDALSVEDLIRWDSLNAEMATLLSACVRANLNIIVSGGTGTGKTTLLNVLSSFIPSTERIITIEDAVEIQMQQDHVVRLESRPPNVEGKGEVTIRDLVRNSLRMRPDRIVIGEVRGAEALDLLQAMNTGHDGSLSTIHANSPRDALSRLETLVLMAGMDLPLRAVREQVASAVDLIVQIARLRDGTRRVVNVTEINGMEGQTITMQDIFVFDHAAGVDHNGHFLGHAIPTGVRPAFAERFAEMGIPLAASVFGPVEGWRP